MSSWHSFSNYFRLSNLTLVVFACRFRGWVDKYPEEPSFVLPKCLVEKVEAGDLGRKTGKGFYNWDGDKRGDPGIDS